MARRLTRIYTRSGDDGTTGLGDGRRVPKDDPRIEAIGTVDELNACIGLLRAQPMDGEMGTLLAGIQHRLFDLGGELAIPGSEVMVATRVTDLEQRLDAYNATLPMLDEFVLPAGGEAAARCHLARTVCRRAERELLRLARTEPVNSAGIHYLNRLSDLLFVVARWAAHQAGRPEVTWRNPSRRRRA